MSSVLMAENIQIIDWRDVNLSNRIAVAMALIFKGFVEIKWKKQTHKVINLK